MELLEKSADLLSQAERYEVTGEIYKLVIPVYEQDRNFNVSSNINVHHVLVVICDATQTQFIP